MKSTDIYTYADEVNNLEATFHFLILFSIALFVLGVVFYILLALGIKRMSVRENFRYSWLAFIPIAQYYVMGKLVEERTSIKNLPLWLLWGGIAVVAFCWVPVLNLILAIGYGIILLIVYHEVFSKYSDYAVVMTIYGILFSIQPLFIFAIRNNPIREKLNS